MIILATPRFTKTIKKLLPNEKKSLDQAVSVIIKSPEIGEMKKGDLSGTRVFKYRFLQQQMLLAYSISLDQTKIVLMSYGTHENFYRDLKKFS
jgi:mRNA-degrading endonuclease YafQ of YafQ-DinJ toxin-antitoxin module